jgi:uncharacterized protein (DUF2062 family)
MFKRRIPLPFVHRLKELFWPRSGFSRATRYIAHRISRLPGTPYRIAAGFACGAAISFTPFLGAHFVLALLISLAIRGSIVASAFGTLVGNPLTFPFIWAWLYVSGCWLLGQEVARDLPTRFSAAYIFDHPWEILWPMTVSGIPTALAAWCVFFLPVRVLVLDYQRARRWRIRRKVMRRRRRMQAAGLEAETSDGQPMHRPVGRNVGAE